MVQGKDHRTNPEKHRSVLIFNWRSGEFVSSLDGSKPLLMDDSHLIVEYDARDTSRVEDKEIHIYTLPSLEKRQTIKVGAIIEDSYFDKSRDNFYVLFRVRKSAGSAFPAKYGIKKISLASGSIVLNRISNDFTDRPIGFISGIPYLFSESVKTHSGFHTITIFDPETFASGSSNNGMILQFDLQRKVGEVLYFGGGCSSEKYVYVLLGDMIARFKRTRFREFLGSFSSRIFNAENVVKGIMKEEGECLICNHLLVSNRYRDIDGGWNSHESGIGGRIIGWGIGNLMEYETYDRDDGLSIINYERIHYSNHSVNESSNELNGNTVVLPNGLVATNASPVQSLLIEGKSAEEIWKMRTSSIQNRGASSQDILAVRESGESTNRRIYVFNNPFHQ